MTWILKLPLQTGTCVNLQKRAGLADRLGTPVIVNL